MPALNVQQRSADVATMEQLVVGTAEAEALILDSPGGILVCNVTVSCIKIIRRLISRSLIMQSAYYDNVDLDIATCKMERNRSWKLHSIAP